ncbi:MAG: diguanylate cyclase domain-containing protein [Roseburia sp.]
MKKILAKKSIIIFFGCLLSLLLAVSIFHLFLQKSETSTSTISLSENWTLQINDSILEHVNLDETAFPETQKGDTLSLTCTLPAESLDAPELIFLSCHSTVTILLDGEQIYEYGMERYEKGLMLGYGNHFVTLSDDSAGKTLTILLSVTEDHAFTTITSPILSNGYFCKLDYIRNRVLPFFIGIFLIIFGLAFFFLSFFMLTVSNDFLPLIGISLVSLCIGLWSLCSYHLLQLFTPSIYICSYIEYLSLYVAPIPLFFIFQRYINDFSNRLLTIIYYILFSAEIIFVFAALLCQTFNILHFPALLGTFHILCVLFLFVFLFTALLLLRKQTLESLFLMIGIVTFIIFSALDLLRFNLEKYTAPFLKEDFNGLMPIGALILVLLLLVSFCIRMSQSYYSRAKQELLEYQAHTDSMTGLSNRRLCEKEMARIESESDHTVYGIISLDLNNLKSTNDTFGHECGDQLIIAFADILKDVFSPYGITGRMGGDEFIVLIPDTSTVDVRKLIAIMNLNIQKKNDIFDRFYISTSLGYADSTEGKSVHDVYKLADSRMYEHKHQYKQQHH